MVGMLRFGGGGAVLKRPSAPSNRNSHRDATSLLLAATLLATCATNGEPVPSSTTTFHQSEAIAQERSDAPTSRATQ